jgi:hypothetical protein
LDDGIEERIVEELIEVVVIEFYLPPTFEWKIARTWARQKKRDTMNRAPTIGTGRSACAAG